MNEILAPLEWKTVKRKVSDLVPSDFNPRKITPENQKRLEDKITRLGFIDLPTIDIDNSLVSGHKRLKALFALGKGNSQIEVRIPNRKLTDHEFKEIMLNSNIHEGEFDFSEVEEYFQEIDFESLGLESIELGNIDEAPVFSEEPSKPKTDKEIIKEIKEMEVKPYERTHVLLSFPPEKIIQIKPFLEEILKFEYIEYEQSSN